jgi:hypothetical protein
MLSTQLLYKNYKTGRVVFSNSPCPYQGACVTDKRPKKSMPCRKKYRGADFLSICLFVSSTAHIYAISYLNALYRCFLVREIHGKKKENGKSKYICASSQKNKYVPSVFLFEKNAFLGVSRQGSSKTRGKHLSAFPKHSPG